MRLVILNNKHAYKCLVTEFISLSLLLLLLHLKFPDMTTSRHLYQNIGLYSMVMICSEVIIFLAVKTRRNGGKFNERRIGHVSWQLCCTNPVILTNVLEQLLQI